LAQRKMISPVCPVCNNLAGFKRAGAIVFAPKIIKEALECDNCQGFFLFPIPDQAEIAQVYQPDYYRGFFRNWWKDYYRGKSVGKKLSRLKTKGKFLDVGCAIGSMLAGIKESCDWQVFGIEMDEKIASYARKRGLTVFTQPLESLNLEDGSFDYIFANNVIEHIPLPLKFLKAAHRLLAPDGVLQLSTPNGPVDIYPSLKLVGAGEPKLTRHTGHINFFSRKGLYLLAERSGFTIKRFKIFHIKTALKCRLIWPGSKRKLSKRITPEVSRDLESFELKESKRSLFLEDFEKLIPPKPPAWLYNLRSWSRRLYRAFPVPLGADFEVILRRSERASQQ